MSTENGKSMYYISLFITIENNCGFLLPYIVIILSTISFCKVGLWKWVVFLLFSEMMTKILQWF